MPNPTTTDKIATYKGLSEAQESVLQDLIANGPVDLNEVQETYRERAIELGMMEPPLTTVNGPWLLATPAGRALIANTENGDG